jgi:hypothetical protein
LAVFDAFVSLLPLISTCVECGSLRQLVGRYDRPGELKNSARRYARDRRPLDGAGLR